MSVKLCRVCVDHVGTKICPVCGDKNCQNDRKKCGACEDCYCNDCPECEPRVEYRKSFKPEKVYLIKAFEPGKFETFVVNGVVYRDLKTVKRIAKQLIASGIPATWDEYKIL